MPLLMYEIGAVETSNISANFLFVNPRRIIFFMT